MVADWDHKQEYHVTLKASVLRDDLWYTSEEAGDLREGDEVCWIAVLGEHYVVTQSFRTAEYALYELGNNILARRALAKQFGQQGPFEGLGPAPTKEVKP